MMIADKIKQLRTSRNMTQSDLAKKIKYNQKQRQCVGNGTVYPFYRLSGGTFTAVPRLNRLLIRTF